MASTTKQRGGCLSVIIILVLVFAFFTNPEKYEFEDYLKPQITNMNNTMWHNGQTYYFDVQRYKSSIQRDNYFICSFYYMEKRLYRTYSDMLYDRPTHIIPTEHFGMFANFWNTDRSYQPL
jgi:hypothetical protein